MGGGTESTEGVGRQEPPSASNAVCGATDVQYQDVLLTKFGHLIPKYICVLCVYLLLIAVLILK